MQKMVVESCISFKAKNLSPGSTDNPSPFEKQRVAGRISPVPRPFSSSSPPTSSSQSASRDEAPPSRLPGRRQSWRCRPYFDMRPLHAPSAGRTVMACAYTASHHARRGLEKQPPLPVPHSGGEKVANSQLFCKNTTRPANFLL